MQVNEILGKPDRVDEALPIIKKDYSESYFKEGYSIGIESNYDLNNIKIY